MLFYTVFSLANKFSKDNIFQKIFLFGKIIAGNEQGPGKSHIPEQYFRVFWKCHKLLLTFAKQRRKDRKLRQKRLLENNRKFINPHVRLCPDKQRSICLFWVIFVFDFKANTWIQNGPKGPVKNSLVFL